jgi:hypothetical protein
MNPATSCLIQVYLIYLLGMLLISHCLGLKDQNEVFSLTIDLKDIPREITSKHKSQNGKGYYYTFNVKVEIRVYYKVAVTVFLCNNGKKLADYQTKL